MRLRMPDDPRDELEPIKTQRDRVWEGGRAHRAGGAGLTWEQDPCTFRPAVARERRSAAVIERAGRRDTVWMPMWPSCSKRTKNNANLLEGQTHTM
jgi:hypothetical protein